MTVANGKITNLTLSPATFNMYAGGLATAAKVTGSEINKTTMAKVQPYTVENSNLVFYLEDTMSGGKLATTWKGTDAPDGYSDRANIYRVLATVFGDLIVQKAYINDKTNLVEASYWSEQQLYNTQFASNFVQLNGEDISFALDASLYTEIVRFGYQGAATNANYGQGNATVIDTAGYSSINSITFVKALNQGVATQMANNI